MSKKEYPSIYCLKGICSLLVVLVHAQFFFHDLYVPVYRLAVPLFFVISGFFLVDETGNIKTAKIIPVIKKMLKINITTSIVYILFFIIKSFIVGTDSYISILYPKDFLLSIFLGHPYCGVLWYVTAYIEILLILKLFASFHKEKILFYLIPFFLLLELFVGKYSFIIGDGFDHFYHRNFFTMGLPFVLIGILIKKYQLFKRLTHPKVVAFLLLIISYVEYLLLQKNAVYREGDLVISSMFLVPVIFIIFLNSTSIKMENLLSVIGKKYSLNLYLYHPMVLTIYYLLHLNKILHNFEYPIVLLITLLGCIFAKKIKDTFSKRLYSI